MLIRNLSTPSAQTPMLQLGSYLLTDFAFQTFRQFSTKRPRSEMYYIPHAFPLEEARKKFAEAEKNRLLAPLEMERENSSALSTGLKKVFIPFFGLNARISHTDYRAQYGIDTTMIVNKVNITYTTWYPISGSLGPIHYTPADHTRYAGFTWHAGTLEKAFRNYDFTLALQPFDPNKVDEDILIDPFLKRGAIGQEEASESITDFETNRIINNVHKRAHCDQVSYIKHNIHFDDFYLSSFLLPAYILEFPFSPPRILPAMHISDVEVHGAAPLSPIKLTALGAASGLLLALIPGSMAARVAVFTFSTLFSSFWARYGRDVRYFFENNGCENAKENNETVSETEADRLRFQFTSRNFKTFTTSSPLLNVDASFYETMGLDPTKPVTREMVSEAFIKLIKENHSDTGGSDQKTRELLKAREVFYSALPSKSKPQNAEPGKRHFSTTGKPVRVKAPPRSVFDLNANQLIVKVLDKKDYAGALEMVRSERVHPDGHNARENTLLTEAAKRGDVKAIEFAVDKLGASVDTSCDCPHHNTALHYAVKGNYTQVVDMLLKKGANPNLINSLGETPLDLAHIKKKTDIIRLLETSGGLRHQSQTSREGILSRVRGTLFGYGSNERTRLLEKNDDVIYLPPSGKPSNKK